MGRDGERGIGSETRAVTEFHCNGETKRLRCSGGCGGVWGWVDDMSKTAKEEIRDQFHLVSQQMRRQTQSENQAQTDTF